MAQQSGDFNNETTWCGGLVPVDSLCTSSGGCVVNIPSNITVAITDIDGQLSLSATAWIIDGTLNLGLPNLPASFYFGASCNVSVNRGGALVDLTTGNATGIYFPQNSILAVHPNGLLKGQVFSFLYLYQLDNISNVLAQTMFNTTQFFSPTQEYVFYFNFNSTYYVTYPSDSFQFYDNHYHYRSLCG